MATLVKAFSTRLYITESVSCLNRGCVTPNILAELAATPDSNITGFESLK